MITYRGYIIKSATLADESGEGVTTYSIWQNSHRIDTGFESPEAARAQINEWMYAA